jgi:deoxyhypusine synthase
MSHYLKEPTTPIEPKKGEKIDDLLRKMSNISFQGRNLAQAFEIWQNMLKDKTTIFFGLAGAMVPAGMRKLIVYLINQRLIDCIVSTGANLFHDCAETLGYYHWKGSPQVDDVSLWKEGIDRIYDTFAVESEFRKTDEFIENCVKELDQEHEYTTRELHYFLGKKLSETCKEEGILSSAFKKKVPIFCPALADSSIGIAVALGRFRKSNKVTFDIIRDILESAYIVRESVNTGVIYIGGGTPKNFIQQAMVVSNYLYQKEETGHKYAIQITADAPHWGGLSGCTFEEAKSWGKIAEKALKVSVHCDATIALPVLVAGLTEMVDDIERGAKINFDMGEELKMKVNS